MIVCRYADDMVLGFQYEDDAQMGTAVQKWPRYPLADEGALKLGKPLTFPLRFAPFLCRMIP